MTYIQQILNYQLELIKIQINFIDGDSYVTLERFIPSKMVRSLRKFGFARKGTYRGYSLFNRESGSRLPGTLAINNMALISDYKHDSFDTGHVVKTIIDAKLGIEDRYVEQNEAFTTLTTYLNGGDVIWIGTSPANKYTFSDVSDFRNVPLDIGGWVYTPAYHCCY